VKILLLLAGMQDAMFNFESFIKFFNLKNLKPVFKTISKINYLHYRPRNGRKLIVTWIENLKYILAVDKFSNISRRCF